MLRDLSKVRRYFSQVHQSLQRSVTDLVTGQDLDELVLCSGQGRGPWSDSIGGRFSIHL